MRFVVFGAGAVGGVIGGRLFERGQEVMLIARGSHYDAIHDRGLCLESPDGVTALPIPVADRPDRVGIVEGDIVLLATKSQDTWAALTTLASTAPPTIPVVCVQNGVDNERQALRLFANVYGVCVMCPTTHVAPGVVQANSAPISGILDVGRYPTGVDTTAERIASAFQTSTFMSEARADIMRWKYTKLLMNLGNAVEALCGPQARRGPLTGLARREGMECLQAAGIDFASQEEDAERRGDLLTQRPIRGRSRGGGSSWQSLARETGSIEADYLNGEVVLLGRLHGVPTPVNAALQGLANQMAHDRKPPGSVAQEDVLRIAGVHR